MDSGFTIAGLIDDPTIDTQLISGSSGLNRTVLWAHSCEMPSPARWLGPHELLMTIGLCVPRGAKAQQAFISELDEAGIAGITIGDHGLAPQLTAAMIEESESRGFPILATGPTTPFAAIGRTVAAANSDSQTMSVLVLAKLYQIAGRRNAAARRSGTDLSDLFGTRLTVVDDETGCVVIGHGVLATPNARAYPLQTRRRAHLLIPPDAVLDGLFLVHLSQLLAVDTDAIVQDAVTQAKDGATAIELALAARREGRVALAGMWSDPSSGFRAVVTQCDTALRVPLALILAGVSPTVREQGTAVTLVVPSVDLPTVRQIFADLDVVAGVSAEHHDLADIPGAVAEARTACTDATARQQAWYEFQGEQVSLLARSKSESEQIINTVLGPLARAAPRYTSLRDTLFTFLDNDSSWKMTAEALGLHRQSLVYRLNQVERLTGRSVRRTKDLSDFWLARTAWNQREDSRA